MSVLGIITERRPDCANFTVVNVNSTNLCKCIDAMGQASLGSWDRGLREVTVCAGVGVGVGGPGVNYRYSSGSAVIFLLFYTSSSVVLEYHNQVYLAINT